MGFGRIKRDNQRSLCYAWEKAVTGGKHFTAQWATMDEVAAYMKPIWKSERGRYGRANVPMPTLHHGHWDQRRALAYGNHTISLPRWSRNEWVVLHEMAHRLTPSDEAHGPRFIGVLMGLAARHAGYDVEVLKSKADEMGLRYYAGSIGAVPAVTLSQKLRALLPTSDMDAAILLGVSYRQIHGAALALIRAGTARWYRGKITPLATQPKEI
jgi:putative metallohydrolase (TIGR04338 family)